MKQCAELGAQILDCAAAVLALQAGCDVLLMPNSLPEAYAAVLEAVQNGTITQERLDQSVNKILRYKEVFTHV